MLPTIASSISTRPALDSDKPGIWRLYEEALRHHIEAIWGWHGAWQTDNFDQAFISLQTRVVEVDGQLAGYLQVDVREVEDYLSMLVLAPAYRSLGIGARLLSETQADSRSKARGLHLRVFRTNANARRFYERNGWEVVADEGDFISMRPVADRARPEND
jgi:ribosomal protein S18 acetylase RimI-like enzyme